jgi:hypothetical protein
MTGVQVFEGDGKPLPEPKDPLRILDGVDPFYSFRVPKERAAIGSFTMSGKYSGKLEMVGSDFSMNTFDLVSETIVVKGQAK